MMSRNRVLGALLVAVMFALLGIPTTAGAHGHAEVGAYMLVLGFRNEPAYVGEPNAIELRVTNTKTGEPVEDLADTLHAEIGYGDARRQLALRPRWGMPGVYTADVIPTAAGDYTVRIGGAIAGTPVDVTLTSGPESFSPVETAAAVAFPAAQPAPAELQAAADAAYRLAQAGLAVGGIAALLAIAALGRGALRSRHGRRSAASAAAIAAPAPAER
jgi:hypothetical protein